MRRVGHLFEEVTSFRRLLHAFHAARRGCGRWRLHGARQGSGARSAPGFAPESALGSTRVSLWNDEISRFFFHLETELLALRRELLEERYRPGPYRTFEIHDPKRRVIAVAPFRDRVVHHALVYVLIPVYEPCLIADSYATCPGKGTHRAVLRAQHRAQRWPWYLKMDIAGYFASIEPGIVLDLLACKLKDRRLLDLWGRIVRHGTGCDGCGLPIGCGIIIM